MLAVKVSGPGPGLPPSILDLSGSSSEGQWQADLLHAP